MAWNYIGKNNKKHKNCVKCGKSWLFGWLDEDGLCSSCKIKEKVEQKQNKTIPNNNLKVSVEMKSFTPTYNYLNQEEYEEMRQIEKDYFDENFNFYDVDAINQIDPRMETPFDSTTGQLDYHLQRRASEHKRNNRLDLAIACLRKSNEIMALKGMQDINLYMRYVEFLKLNRQFQEAREEESRIELMFKKEEESTKEDLSKFKSDLVIVNNTKICCEKCAMYRCRVYSISGHDNRFPKLPEFLINNKNHCGLYLKDFFIDNRSLFWDKYDNLHIGLAALDEIIEHSNRPFIDDRTQEEKEEYHKWQLHDKEYDEYMKQKKLDRNEYDWLSEFLPDIAPKSFAGYRKMKSINSKNFQKIVETAKENGFIIEVESTKTN